MYYIINVYQPHKRFNKVASNNHTVLFSDTEGVVIDTIQIAERDIEWLKNHFEDQVTGPGKMLGIVLKESWEKNYL